jgi:hypothetical protein
MVATISARHSEENTNLVDCFVMAKADFIIRKIGNLFPLRDSQSSVHVEIVKENR